MIKIAVFIIMIIVNFWIQLYTNPVDINIQSYFGIIKNLKICILLYHCYQDNYRYRDNFVMHY